MPTGCTSNDGAWRRYVGTSVPCCPSFPSAMRRGWKYHWTSLWTSKWGTKSQVGPHVGGLATAPLLSRGSPTFQSGGQNHRWAHIWAVWLHHTCCLGDPQRFRAGDKIRCGPTCGRFGYITPAVSGIPNASKRGTKSDAGPHVGGLATSPLLSRGSPTLQSGGQNQMRAHMWAVWLHHPCCLGGPQRFKAGDKIRGGPTCGWFGYITLAVSGVPNASKRGTKSEVGPHVGGLAASPQKGCPKSPKSGEVGWVGGRRLKGKIDVNVVLFSLAHHESKTTAKSNIPLNRKKKKENHSLAERQRDTTCGASPSPAP